MTATDPERLRLLEEISSLKCAYEARRTSPRPMPNCVEKAFRAALHERLRQLDSLDGKLHFSY